jgi:hypothetical protein
VNYRSNGECERKIRSRRVELTLPRRLARFHIAGRIRGKVDRDVAHNYGVVVGVFPAGSTVYMSRRPCASKSWIVWDVVVATSQARSLSQWENEVEALRRALGGANTNSVDAIRLGEEAWMLSYWEKQQKEMQELFGGDAVGASMEAVAAMV